MKKLNIAVIIIMAGILTSCVDSSNQVEQNKTSGNQPPVSQSNGGVNSAKVDTGTVLSQSVTGAVAVPAAWEIETSDVSNVKPILTTSYTYLDSEKVSYETATLGDLIKPFKYTVVYFYPKDGTPNCTIQALDFSAKKKVFESYGAQVIGVSKDDLDSHKKFAERNELTIKLLQDKKSELLNQFGALGPLQEYGNGTELSDILRSTFIIDSNGRAIRAFKDVQAMGHADRVLSVVKSLQ